MVFNYIFLKDKKMKVNNNISKRSYLITGFENGIFFKVTMTLVELLSNSGNDTELLYTIQDHYIDGLIDLKVNESMCIKSSRDSDFGCDSVVCRIS